MDTPGTNAVLREHEALTRDFVPRADLVLFVTSADRPYTESERAFLEALREWGKKVVVVLNKADLLETPEDVGQASLAFVREQAGEDARAPRPRSSRSPRGSALRARERGDAAGARSERASRLRGEGHGHARRGRALPPQAPEPARRRAPGPSGRRRRSWASGSTCCSRATSRPSRRSRRASSTSRPRSTATSASASRTSRRCSSTSSSAATPSSTSGCASAASASCSTASGCAATSRRRWWPACRARSSGGWTGSWTGWSRRSCAQWQDVMRAPRASGRPPAARLARAGRRPLRLRPQRGSSRASARRRARRSLHYDAPSEARRLAEKVRESVAQAALLQVSALGLGAIVAALASTTAADVTGILAAGVLSLHRPLRAARAAREGAPGARGQGHRACARSSWPRSP